LATLGVGSGLLVLDRRPFGVTGHSKPLVMLGTGGLACARIPTITDAAKRRNCPSGPSSCGLAHRRATASSDGFRSDVTLPHDRSQAALVPVNRRCGPAMVRDRARLTLRASRPSLAQSAELHP